MTLNNYNSILATMQIMTLTFIICSKYMFKTLVQLKNSMQVIEDYQSPIKFFNDYDNFC